MLAEPENVTDSPDLGPPPVAHFEEGDPIKFDHDQAKPSRKDTDTAADGVEPQLSVNLETRRKRRESSHNLEATSRPVQPTGIQSTTDQPLRSGAKRKLNVRDDEDPTEKVSEKNIFRFNCKDVASITTGIKPDGEKIAQSIGQKVSQDLATVREMSRDRTREVAATTTARKALGPSKFLPLPHPCYFC